LVKGSIGTSCVGQHYTQKKGEGQHDRRGQHDRQGCYDSGTLRIPFRTPPPGSKPFDVAALGLNSIDLLAVVAEHPASNSKQRVQRFARLPGGQMATAMTTCARLGWRARYVGCFGDDELGAVSRESLVREGVDITGSRTVAGAANQFAVILVDARSGARTVLWDRDPALAMDPADVPEEAVTSGRLLIVDCHETAAATQAARYARAAGIPTIIDVEKVRPGIGELLQSIDAIIASHDFPSALTGHEDLGRALQAIGRDTGAPLVCATLGEAGSLAWCRGREIRTPAFPVDCVDSTGAGDAFRGAFAAACLRAPEAEVEDALTYANAVAALNCRALGARGGLPTQAEIDELLTAHPHL
jgi:sulfofructose kinase